MEKITHQLSEMLRSHFSDEAGAYRLTAVSRDQEKSE
jgi:hypothetical protein